jgi:cyclopropane-fatty-acyl-phospholipid synthase
MFKRSFIDRYIFPDGELHEIGSVVSRVQRAGLGVRHVESLREHYALTLRAWVANLEQHWQDAVAAVGPTRARIWRLYLAGSALGFEVGEIQIHQTLAVRAEQGRSEMSPRPTWDSSPLTPPQVQQAR